jgi:hypothetical protein
VRDNGNISDILQRESFGVRLFANAALYNFRDYIQDLFNIMSIIKSKSKKMRYVAHPVIVSRQLSDYLPSRFSEVAILCAGKLVSVP